MLILIFVMCFARFVFVFFEMMALTDEELKEDLQAAVRELLQQKLQGRRACVDALMCIGFEGSEVTIKIHEQFGDTNTGVELHLQESSLQTRALLAEGEKNRVKLLTSFHDRASFSHLNFVA